MKKRLKRKMKKRQKKRKKWMAKKTRRTKVLQQTLKCLRAWLFLYVKRGVSEKQKRQGKNLPLMMIDKLGKNEAQKERNGRALRNDSAVSLFRLFLSFFAFTF
jgi:hypothetical protein